MTERYWEPGYIKGESITDLLNNWVEQNVIRALTELIKEGTAGISVYNGKVFISFYSFEKPQIEGIPIDCWHKHFDLLDMAMEYSKTYDVCENLSDSQRKEFAELANLFDEIALKFRERAGLLNNKSSDGD